MTLYLAEIKTRRVPYMQRAEEGTLIRLVEAADEVEAKFKLRDRLERFSPGGEGFWLDEIDLSEVIK